MSVGERACIYACLILHDGGIAITADKIATLAKAANVTVESYWPRLFAKLSEKKNLDELIINIGAAAATDDKEWTIGLPKPSIRDTNAVDSSSSSSEWSYDEESEQDAFISRDPYSKESEEAVKLHLLENTDWYRMRMDEINTPRPPPPAPLPVPSPLPPPAGYMSLEEQNKALDEFLEEHSKKSGTSSHNALMAYLTKKILKDSV